MTFIAWLLITVFTSHLSLAQDLLTVPFAGQTTQTGWVNQMSSANANDAVTLNSAGTGPSLVPKWGMQLINGTVLTANINQFTWINIPQTFNQLEIIISGRTNNAGTWASISMCPNGDTSTSSFVFEYEYGSNAATAASYYALQDGMLAGYLPSAGSTATYAGTIRCTIPNYTSTTFYKAAVCVCGIAQSTGANSMAMQIGTTWKNTAAITSLQLRVFGGSDTFPTGTGFYLYGIL